MEVNLNIEVGQIYIGKFHKESVMYIGLKKFEETGEWLHQFEYLWKHETVIGYGQTCQQVLNDEYRLEVTNTVLYGHN